MASGKVVDLVIDATTITAVYDDELLPLIDRASRLTTERASFVEPASTYCGGCSRPFPCACGHPRRPVADIGWVADMAPSGGPLLGTYLTRADALTEERRWLADHKGV